MEDILDAQGSTITWGGVTLGVCEGVSANAKAATVHDVTGTRSRVLGSGANARVLRQYTVTSVDPGTITARFQGSPMLSRDSVGLPQTLTFSWATGSVSYEAVLVDVVTDFQRGELIQWAAVFQFTGF